MAIFKHALFMALIITVTFAVTHPALALKSIDRVAAFIGNDAITMRELKEEFKKRKVLNPSETINDTLDALINTRLMLKAAADSKLTLGTVDEKIILERYIDLKIKASVLISEADIKKFYRKNRDRFKGADYNTVRPEIRKYLEEREFNKALLKHIEHLRKNARIRILELDEQP